MDIGCREGSVAKNRTKAFDLGRVRLICRHVRNIFTQETRSIDQKEGFVLLNFSKVFYFDPHTFRHADATNAAICTYEEKTGSGTRHV